jgi:hypothetical protein
MSSRVYPSLASSQAGIKQVVVLAVFYPFAIAAIVLRIISRRIKGKSLALNDYAALLALLFTTAQAVIGWVGEYASEHEATMVLTFTAVGWAGSGHHITDVDPRFQARVFILFSAGQSIYAAANTAVKFSILHLYIVIFPSRTVRRICYCTMALSVGYWIHIFLETFVLCTPVQYNWDKTIAGTCDPNTLIAYILAGTINLILDIFIVALPMPLLWSLHMSLPKKLGTISMFSLGAV